MSVRMTHFVKIFQTKAGLLRFEDFQQYRFWPWTLTLTSQKLAFYYIYDYEPEAYLEIWKGVPDGYISAGRARATAGPRGNHYRGALSQPHSVGAEIETPKASRGGKLGEGYPLTIWLRVWGSVISSPSGVRGMHIWGRKKPPGTPFLVFSAMSGPPKRRGPGKTFPPLPLSTGLHFRCAFSKVVKI